jgi:hypothetical protein
VASSYVNEYNSNIFFAVTHMAHNQQGNSLEWARTVASPLFREINEFSASLKTINLKKIGEARIHFLFKN